MAHIGLSRRRRLTAIGVLAAPLALAGWIGVGIASGAGTAPSMEVLPSTGLKYSQTVEVKGHHLPKGSGSTAVTICGLQDASGKTIANPGADDCAGASEVGKLVVVKSWQSNGELDTQYTLPASGQKFGTNNRFCDKTHHCAVVVADANPNAPAYHVALEIQFADQQSTTTTTKPKSTPTTKPGTTPTTKPVTPTTKPGSTPTTEPPPGPSTPPAHNAAAGAVNGSVAATPSPSGAGASISVHAGATVTVPTSGGATPTVPPLTIPPAAAPTIAVPAPVAQALGQVCAQLGGAVKQAGGDPTLLILSCNSLAAGSGPQQLAIVLQSPSLLCIEGASAWQNNAQITSACTQTATALAPVTAPLAASVLPLLTNI